MRKYKAIVIVTIVMTLIPFMQSCLNDYDDDLYNIQGGMPFNAGLATVVNPSEVPGEAVIESDNDGIAYVVNPEKLTRLETNNLGQRIFYINLWQGAIFCWNPLRLFCNHESDMGHAHPGLFLQRGIIPKHLQP